MLHREVIHSGQTEYTIIKIDSHRVLVDQFKQDGDMGSRGTWVFDTQNNHPTLLPDYVLSKIHIMLNEPEIVWIVGEYLGTTQAKDLAWEIVAVCSSEVEALKITLARPQYVNYFLGPMELDGPPVHESKEWEGAYYPVNDRSRVRRTLAEVGIPLEDIFKDDGKTGFPPYTGEQNTDTLPVIQQVLDKIGNHEVVGGFHKGTKQTEQLIDEIEETNGGAFVVSMDARKLVGDNYLGMPGVTDRDIIDHLNKEIQVARDFVRTHHLSAKFQSFQEKYMETPEPMTRDFDPTGKDQVTAKDMSNSWWTSMPDEEKAAVFSKYIWDKKVTWNTIDEDDIFDLFIYEHPKLRAIKEAKEESKPCPQCNAANGDSHEFGCTYR